ncbi:MAG: F0F1 ATP synthase subunit epsilon [Actinomycetota bacterium]
MRLVIALPNRIEVDAPVEKVSAEGTHGTFTLLPHHLDYVVLLEPGILTYMVEGEEEAERYVAVDGGVLTKVGDEVLVSTRAAVAGDRLEELERIVVRSFRLLDERERSSRAALARIEGHLLREIFEFEERV